MVRPQSDLEGGEGKAAGSAAGMICPLRGLAAPSVGSAALTQGAVDAGSPFQKFPLAQLGNMLQGPKQDISIALLTPQPWHNPHQAPLESFPEEEELLGTHSPGGIWARRSCPLHVALRAQGTVSTVQE